MATGPRAIMESGDILEPLRDRIVGRVSQEEIYDPRAVVELADDGESIRRVQPFRLFIQSTRRPKVREPDLAAGVLNAIAENVERAAPLDLRREAFQELILDRYAMMLGEPLPLPRLRRQDEVEDTGAKETQRRVVVRRALSAIAARKHPALGERGIPDNTLGVAACVRAVLKEPTFESLPRSCVRKSRDSCRLRSLAEDAQVAVIDEQPISAPPRQLADDSEVHQQLDRGSGRGEG